MPDDLYDRDILEWSRRQAERLRRVARGERVNDVDWEHVVEEIEDVGKSEVASVRSLLRRALVHLLKRAAWPDSDAVVHRGIEAGGFLTDAADRFAPSMRRHIAVDAIYERALTQLRADRARFDPSAPLPDVCPFTLDDPLTDPPDIAALQARLSQSIAANSRAE